MKDELQNQESLNFNDFQKPVLPQTLNVLTILTIIGCSIFLIFAIASPWATKFSKSMMEKASASENLSSKQLEDMEHTKQILAITEKNMIPLMVIGLASIILCFAGAIMMRKLKKDGYWIYIAGQAIGIIGNLFILGSYQFADWKNYFGYLITAVFIFLYTTQKKYLVY